VTNFAGPMNAHPIELTTRPHIIRHRGLFCMCAYKQEVEEEGER